MIMVHLCFAVFSQTEGVYTGDEYLFNADSEDFTTIENGRILYHFECIIRDDYCVHDIVDDISNRLQCYANHSIIKPVITGYTVHYCLDTNFTRLDIDISDI